jgi:hypothetical protein
MHGPPEDPGAIARGLAEFAWVIQRYRIDRALMRRHYLRLGVGLVATVLVVAYNAFHPHASSELQQRVYIAACLALAFLMGSLAVLAIGGWRMRRALAMPSATLRLRVMRVVDFVHRWGNLLLLLTALGHGLLVIGTLLGLDVFAASGCVLVAAFVPLLLLIIHGFTQIPTARRLCEIYLDSRLGGASRAGG